MWGCRNILRSGRGPRYGITRSIIQTSSPLLAHARNYGNFHRVEKHLPTRDEQLHRLRTTDEFDVLIVGGGATGTGAALDAQLRGLNTCLIERGDFANETSSRSTKLIWAGIRYIGTATGTLLRWKNLTQPRQAWNNFASEIKMVMGAHRERKFLLDTQPYLTNWRAIAVPIDRWVIWPAPMGHPLFALIPLVLPAVMKLYDSLSRFTCPPSYIMSRRQAQEKFPMLRESVKYVQVFYEGQHNDSRTAIAVALSAAREGSCVTHPSHTLITLTTLPNPVVKLSSLFPYTHTHTHTHTHTSYINILTHPHSLRCMSHISLGAF